MGQKVNPTGMRLGITTEHRSVWYANKRDYAQYLLKDLEIREYLSDRLAHAFVSRIQVERPRYKMKITIHTGRPGIVIGPKGADIDRLKLELEQLMGMPVAVDVQEIRKPELDAYLVAANVASQLERRVAFRRAMRRVVTNAMKFGSDDIKGIKIRVAGRLGGVEIARAETYSEGRVPLHTLRAEIDYSLAEAKTTYGVIGVKVWIFKGEILNKEKTEVAG